MLPGQLRFVFKGGEIIDTSIFTLKVFLPELLKHTFSAGNGPFDQNVLKTDVYFLDMDPKALELL